MKSIVPYLVLLLAVVLSACKGKTETPEKTSEKAALEIYCKYADNANLTVAYLGDLTVNGKCIDALMLQASLTTPPTSTAKTRRILSWWAWASKPIFWTVPFSIP